MYKKIIKRGEKEYTYYVNILSCNKKEKNSGFHSLINALDKNPVPSRTKNIRYNSYKKFSVRNNLTKLKWQSLVNALDLKSSILPGYVGSNSLFYDGCPTFSVKKIEVNHV